MRLLGDERLLLAQEWPRLRRWLKRKRTLNVSRRNRPYRRISCRPRFHRSRVSSEVSELAYPVVDDMPHMVEEEARQLTEEELQSLERA